MRAGQSAPAELRCGAGDAQGLKAAVAARLVELEAAAAAAARAPPGKPPKPLHPVLDGAGIGGGEAADGQVGRP